MRTKYDEAIATFLAILEREFPGAAAHPMDLETLVDGKRPWRDVSLDGHTVTECPYRHILEAYTAALRVLWASKLDLDARVEKLEEQCRENTPFLLLKEDHEALWTAHEALQLDHADLEAAYFVLQRRASKEE